MAGRGQGRQQGAARRVKAASRVAEDNEALLLVSSIVASMQSGVLPKNYGGERRRYHSLLRKYHHYVGSRGGEIFVLVPT